MNSRNESRAELTPFSAIDEIAIKKGHKYLTVVLDLQTGAVVFVGEGKGAESLDPFWKRLFIVINLSSKQSQ